MSFLVVSGFVYLAFTLTTIGALIPIEPVIRQFGWLIDRLPRKVEELSLTKVSAFMVPFIMFVALYALMSSNVFSLAGERVHFKVHLNISAYISGCYAVLSSLMAISEGPLWDLALSGDRSYVRSGPLIGFACAYIALMGLVTFRYLDLLRRSTRCSWLKAVGLGVTSFVGFGIMVGVMLYLLGPFMGKLR